MENKKIQIKDLNKLFKNLKSKSDESIGQFLINNYKIQISRYRLNGGGRVKILYYKRRKQGLCVLCAAKVKRTNPLTGDLYRLCEMHRVSVDKKRSLSRKT